MPWKVKAFASNSKGRRFKTVMRVDEWDAQALRDLNYWVQGVDEGEKVVIKKVHLGESG